MSGIALKDLLEAGVHFGHQTKRWNPKMKQYIFGERNGIYIIDLARTARLFREAEEFVHNLAADGRYETITKKEVAQVEKEKKKLQKNLEGIRNMSRLPDAVFVVDTRKEKIAVDEARKLKIPVIGVVDTNCDPDEVDFVIPGNDDALRAIRLFASKIADAVLAGRGLGEASRGDDGGDDGDRGRRARPRPTAPRTEQATTPASV